MRGYGFPIGLLVGVVLGGTGVFLFGPAREVLLTPPAQEAPAEPPAGSEAPLIGLASDPAPPLPHRLQASSQEASAGDDGQPTTTKPADAASAVERAAQRKRAAWQKLRSQLRGLRDLEAGAEALVAAIATWRAQTKGDDALLAELAGRSLTVLARWGKLRPADVQGLRSDFGALPVGSPGRPGLAGAVARAFAKDPQLADWIGALPRVEEPKIREHVIWALDETPSRAYRDWVLGMSETESVPSVLDSVWNEDIVVVNLTREAAPRLAETIERRIGRGDLPPVTRAYGYMALGLAAQQAATQSRRTLAALLTTEADPGVRAFGEAVLLAIDKGESNLQALEGLWDDHEPKFGTD